MMSTWIRMAALALALTGSHPVAAQAESLFGPGDRAALATFRPSMEAMTRCNNAIKALAAAAQKDARLKAELSAADLSKDTNDTPIEQDIRQLEKDAPLTAALMARNGCPVRDYYLMVTQFVAVQMLAVPEFAKEMNFLPAETVAFWQKNAAAAERFLNEAEKVLDIKKE